MNGDIGFVQSTWVTNCPANNLAVAEVDLRQHRGLVRTGTFLTSQAALGAGILRVDVDESDTVRAVHHVKDTINKWIFSSSNLQIKAFVFHCFSHVFTEQYCDEGGFVDAADSCGGVDSVVNLRSSSRHCDVGDPMRGAVREGII